MFLAGGGEVISLIIKLFKDLFQIGGRKNGRKICKKVFREKIGKIV